MSNAPRIRSTTILAVRRDGRVAAHQGQGSKREGKGEAVGSDMAVSRFESTMTCVASSALTRVKPS